MKRELDMNNGVRILRKSINYDQLVFEDTHKYCLKHLKNGEPCPAYEKNWACPPASPNHTRTAKKIQQFQEFLIIIYELDLLTWKEQLRMKHPEWSEKKLEQNAFNSHLYNSKIYWGLRNLLKPYLVRKSSNVYVLANADCRRCNKCAKKDDKSCRHPEERIYSMEASGINVDESLRKIGYELLWDGRQRVCQVGLVCFRKSNPFQSLKVTAKAFHEKTLLERAKAKRIVNDILEDE